MVPVEGGGVEHSDICSCCILGAETGWQGHGDGAVCVCVCGLQVFLLACVCLSTGKGAGSVPCEHLLTCCNKKCVAERLVSIFNILIVATVFSFFFLLVINKRSSCFLEPFHCRGHCVLKRQGGKKSSVKTELKPAAEVM